MFKGFELLQRNVVRHSRFGTAYHLLGIRHGARQNVLSSCRALTQYTDKRRPALDISCKCAHCHILSNYAGRTSFTVLDIRFSQLENFHTSVRRFEDAKSLADKTVQILSESKKKTAEKKELAERVAQISQPSESAQPPPAEEISSATPEVPAPAEQPKPLLVRAWRWTVKEAKHYYHGFRLLFIDVKICTRYVWGVLNGRTLTRRERRQLVRTTADLFRLVPFMVFVIVPFMEFLLPVALKLFPGLLPSTFKEADKEKEKLKKRLKAKLEIAKFLQDTVEESALVKSGAGKHTELAREFQQFLTEIREGGTTVKTEDILKFTQLFKDEITLDNMTREHLVALCKLLEVSSIGTTKMIAFQLGVKLRHLKADDKAIYSEGLGSLSESELQQACRARGMRAIGVPEWRLRYQLKQWLDMHLNDKIPISLLLMSRALYLPETLSAEERLKTVIGNLPENTTTEAEIHAAEVTGEKIDPAAKIKLITAEEEAIAREKKEEADALQDKLEETSKKPEVLSDEEDMKKHTIIDKAEIIEEVSKADVILKDATTPVQPPAAVAGEPVVDAVKDVADQELSSQDIEELEDVMEQIAEEKAMDVEQTELDTLKEDVDEYQEDLSQLKTLVETDAQIIESKGAKRLSAAVNRMISSLSGFSDDLHRQKQHLLEEIEVKQVKMRRNEEFQHDKEAMKNLQASIQQRKDDVISINELVLAMRRLQKIPDETRLQKIAEVLDDDKDGQINISQVLRVLHDIGTENVNIKGSQMTDILELIKKEEKAESIEKAEKECSKTGEEGKVHQEEVKEVRQE